MSQRERQRHLLLKMVLEGKNTLKDARKRMGIFYQHAKRHKKDLSLKGPKGLFMEIEAGHPPKALNHELAMRIISLGHSV